MSKKQDTTNRRKISRYLPVSIISVNIIKRGRLYEKYIIVRCRMYGWSKRGTVGVAYRTRTLVIQNTNFLMTSGLSRTESKLEWKGLHKIRTLNPKVINVFFFSYWSFYLPPFFFVGRKPDLQTSYINLQKPYVRWKVRICVKLVNKEFIWNIVVANTSHSNQPSGYL